MAEMTRGARPAPKRTLAKIAQTPMLTTREKLELLTSLRQEASRVTRPRAELGFDAGDVEKELNRLRSRVLKGIGPRVEQQGEGR